MQKTDRGEKNYSKWWGEREEKTQSIILYNTLKNLIHNNNIYVGTIEYTKKN